MKAELSKLESKRGAGNDPMMPTGRMPSIGTEYVRKLRDLKFNETLNELLLKQYEAAKLDEARDATVIQVIDRAVTPEKKIKPRIPSMVFIAGAVSFMFSIAIAFLLEQRDRMCQRPEVRKQLDTLKKHTTFST
jgi:hypothetical protein